MKKMWYDRLGVRREIRGPYYIRFVHRALWILLCPGLPWRTYKPALRPTGVLVQVLHQHHDRASNHQHDVVWYNQPIFFPAVLGSWMKISNQGAQCMNTKYWWWCVSILWQLVACCKLHVMHVQIYTFRLGSMQLLRGVSRIWILGSHSLILDNPNLILDNPNNYAHASWCVSRMLQVKRNQNRVVNIILLWKTSR